MFERTSITNNWSIEFDGKSILELYAAKPKMSYAEIREVILNEGGTINADGIIHKGTARNKNWVVNS